MQLSFSALRFEFDPGAIRPRGESSLADRVKRRPERSEIVNPQLALAQRDPAQLPIRHAARNSGFLFQLLFGDDGCSRRPTARRRINLFRLFEFKRLYLFSEVNVRDPRRQHARICPAEIAQAGYREFLLGEARQLRAIAGPRPAVADAAKSLVFANEKPGSVIKLLAVVERADSLYLFKNSLAADLRLVKILIPEQQVLDRSLHGAVPGLLEVRHLDLKSPARIG